MPAGSMHFRSPCSDTGNTIISADNVLALSQA